MCDCLLYGLTAIGIFTGISLILFTPLMYTNWKTRRKNREIMDRMMKRKRT